MTTFLLLLLFLAPADVTVPLGDLRISSDAGLEVLIDGTHYGVTGEGGIFLQVPTGPRKVTLRSANGAENTFQIVVNELQEAELRVSSLGLRRPLKRPQTGAVEVRRAQGCTASAGSWIATQNTDVLILNSLPIGQHSVAVTCGDRVYRADVNIRTGYLTLLDLDRNARTLRHAGVQKMSLSIDVIENSAIAQAAIPGDWKRALSRIIVAGVRIEAVSQLSGDRIRVTAFASDLRSAYEFQSRLQGSNDIQKVDSCRTFKRPDGYSVEAVLRMFPGR